MKCNANCSQGSPTPEAGLWHEYYIYDKTIPLEPVELGITKQLTYQEHKLTYASTNDVRVPALLCIPNLEREKYPCLVFLHGFGGQKEDCRDIAVIAAAYGYAVFSIDAQYHGEREQPGKIIFAPNLVETRDAVVQTVTDLMRGVDYLETLPIIDNTQPPPTPPRGGNRIHRCQHGGDFRRYLYSRRAAH